MKFSASDYCKAVARRAVARCDSSATKQRAEQQRCSSLLIGAGTKHFTTGDPFADCRSTAVDCSKQARTALCGGRFRMLPYPVMEIMSNDIDQNVKFEAHEILEIKTICDRQCKLGSMDHHLTPRVR